MYKREAFSFPFITNQTPMPLLAAPLMNVKFSIFLPKGKDRWYLMQTVNADGFSLKALNPHCFTAENASLILCFCLRGLCEGNNNSLTSWLLEGGSPADV